ncbi:hypothetical protein F5X68DRAFT_231740 [Plectosphaerella plurivora]|uniref:Uncharacterized protein n=1 Tax=Plectosphaerella plurivora TaxID=936078 RepID=A0A9P9ACM4_9PEZI|nr:hypothetical protein F5X68DRAFT_231740 [Plectosphaerella plurivora]
MEPKVTSPLVPDSPPTKSNPEKPVPAMESGTVSAPIEPTSDAMPSKASPKYSLLRINTAYPIILLIFIWIAKIFTSTKLALQIFVLSIGQASLTMLLMRSPKIHLLVVLVGLGASLYVGPCDSGMTDTWKEGVNWNWLVSRALWPQLFDTTTEYLAGKFPSSWVRHLAFRSKRMGAGEGHKTT